MLDYISLNRTRLTHATDRGRKLVQASGFRVFVASSPGIAQTQKSFSLLKSIN